MKFTRIFGSKLWENPVIVLTKANCVEEGFKEDQEIDPSVSIKEKFEARMSEWKENTQRIAQYFGCQQGHSKKVPILPAGIRSNITFPSRLSFLA